MEKNIIKKIIYFAGSFIFLFTPLVVFVLPIDVLDRCEICLKFTNFMKEYFVSISIFENASSIPQVTAFYISIMWIWSFINMAFFSWITITINDNKIKTNSSLLFIGIVLLILFSYNYFNGSISKAIIEKGWLSGAKTFSVDMGNRIDMLFYVFVIHCAVSLSLPCTINCLLNKIKGVNNEK